MSQGILEKEMAAHSSILAWRVPWTEEPGRLPSMGCKEVNTTKNKALQTWHSPVFSYLYESLSRGMHGGLVECFEFKTTEIRVNDSDSLSITEMVSELTLFQDSR